MSVSACGPRPWRSVTDRSPSVLIAVDLIGVPRAVTEEVARRLADASVRREQFVICATHTHTGPSLAASCPTSSTCRPRRRSSRSSTATRRPSSDQLERVARAALADRRPSRVSWSQGRAGFAANRRVLKDGKWTGFGVTPGGAVDHDVPMLAVHATDGALRAVFVNYACHATTLEGPRQLRARRLARRCQGADSAAASGCRRPGVHRDRRRLKPEPSRRRPARRPAKRRGNCR